MALFGSQKKNTPDVGSKSRTMKNQNMHIPDEDFVPEGLEFREEYMQSALSMYEQARKGLLFKKWLFGSLGVGVIAIASLVFYANSGETKTEYVNQDPIVQTNNQIAAPTSSEVAHNETTPEAYLNSENIEFETSNSTPNSTSNYKTIATPQNKQEQGTTESIQLTTAVQNSSKKTAFNKSKSDVPEISSGALTVSQKTVIDKTNDADHAAQPSMEAKSATSESTSLSKTQIDIAETQAPSENTALLPLQMRAGKFNFEEQFLSTPKTSRLPIVSKWTPFLAVGLNPMTKYGLDYTQPQLNPALSLGIKYKVCRGATLSASLDYFSITGLSHPLLIWNSEYGQGSLKSQTIIYTNTLHYGGLHLQSILPVANRHGLLIGYRMSYLINGQNEILTETTQNSESLPESTTKTNGYILGFRNLNHSLTAGYEYRLGANKYIGVNYSFGLSDITRNEYFGPELDRNSMVGIYLKMNLK
jgi:hypothetical protein